MDINTFITRVAGSGGYRGNNSFIQIAQVLRQVIKDMNSSHILYPKGLYVEDSIAEVYVFEMDSVMRFTEASNNINIEFWKYRDIQKLELGTSTRYDHDKKLSILFLNNDVIKLDSEIDTNIHHSYDFAEKLFELFKRLRSFAS